MKLYLQLLREFLSEQFTQAKNYLQENMANASCDEFVIIRIPANK